MNIVQKHKHKVFLNCRGGALRGYFFPQHGLIERYIQQYKLRSISISYINMHLQTIQLILKLYQGISSLILRFISRATLDKISDLKKVLKSIYIDNKQHPSLLKLYMENKTQNQNQTNWSIIIVGLALSYSLTGLLAGLLIPLLLIPPLGIPSGTAFGTHIRIVERHVVHVDGGTQAVVHQHG